MKFATAIFVSLFLLGSLHPVEAKKLGKKSKDSKFMEMDTNHDAKLSAAEFAAGGGTAEQFKAWDTNGDGYLSEAEYNAGKAKEKQGPK